MEQININHDINNVETAEIPRLQLKNIIGHFQTIRHHKKLVRRECFKMGLYWQGMTHDLSKYSPVEFWSGCRFYQGTRSPNAREREVIGYSRAWLHHKGRNRHHFEYWTDYNPKTKTLELDEFSKLIEENNQSQPNPNRYPTIQK